MIIHQKKILGIEVKTGAIQQNPGMAIFQKKFNPDKILLVGKTGLPWQDFLKLNPADIIK